MPNSRKLGEWFIRQCVIIRVLLNVKSARFMVFALSVWSNMPKEPLLVMRIQCSARELKDLPWKELFVRENNQRYQEKVQHEEELQNACG